MPNQLAIIAAPDVYGQAARRFLQLLPTACINAEKMFLESIKPKSSPQSSPVSSRTNSPPPPPLLTSSPAQHNHLEKPSPSHLTTPKSSSLAISSSMNASTNPFDTPVTRSRSGSNASTCSLSSLSSTSAPHPSMNTTSGTASTNTPGVIGSFQFEYIPPEKAYLHNLETAKEAINACGIRCRCWSNAYDKCEVSKDDLKEALKEQEPPKALEMEDVQVRVTSEEDDTLSRPSAFRSRAVTLSQHSRLSRTTSVKVHDRLQSHRGVQGRTVNGENTILDVQPFQGMRRTGTISGSPRPSPRPSRRIAEDRFEDRAGLLLKIVLEKLSEMMQLSPTVNVLLTRLIARLAHYPHPLLRSILLNHQLVLKPGVPNLLNVSLTWLSQCTNLPS